MESEHTKAIIRGVVALAVVGFGYLMGAAEPKNKWQWIQFLAGLGFVVGPKLIEMLQPSKGITNVNTARRIDAMIEAKAESKAQAMAEKAP